MSDRTEIKRYTSYLTEERNAVALYEKLAEAEPRPELVELYRRLAETEKRHARHWEAELARIGATIPPATISLHTRLLGWLAKRFGTAAVLPGIAAAEGDAGQGYAGTQDKTLDVMAAEERSHARLFRTAADNGGGGLDGSVVARLEGRHRSTGGNALRAGVLGANDGLLSNFSLMMGVAGASTGSNSITSGAVLITGLAGLLAGATSMAFGEWLSVQSSRELFHRQISIEKEELALAPEEEAQELALIYQAKGVPAEEARILASRLLSSPESALDTLAREELGIDPEELGGSAWEAAGTSFLLFALGAIIPVIPYFFCQGYPAAAWSAAVSAVGLFGIGAAITLVTGRNPLWAGSRQVLIGLVSALVTFGIGRLLGVQIAG